MVQQKVVLILNSHPSIARYFDKWMLETYMWTWCDRLFEIILSTCYMKTYSCALGLTSK